jgi:hypothetical protein
LLVLLLLGAAALLLPLLDASSTLLLVSVRMGLGVGRIVAACLISSRPSSCKLTHNNAEVEFKFAQENMRHLAIYA